jgi:RNA polymerase sigma factor (sigma-70 family)
LEDWLEQVLPELDDYVHARLRYAGLSADRADDVLQDALLRIYRQWDHWPAGEREGVGAYAHRILNLVIDTTLRRDRRRGHIAIESLDAAVDAWERERPTPSAVGRAVAERALDNGSDHASEVVERLTILGVLQVLDPVDLQLMHLASHEGLSHAEIADATGLKVSQVSLRLSQATRTVRELYAHATGRAVADAERQRLYDLLDGRLHGGARRHAKLHLDHCSVCQELLARERDTSRRAGQLVVGLPVGLMLVDHVGQHATVLEGVRAAAAANPPAGVAAGPVHPLVSLTTTAGGKLALTLTSAAIALGGTTAAAIGHHAGIDDTVGTAVVVAKVEHASPSGRFDAAGPLDAAVIAQAASAVKPLPRASRHARQPQSGRTAPAGSPVLARSSSTPSSSASAAGAAGASSGSAAGDASPRAGSASGTSSFTPGA